MSAKILVAGIGNIFNRDDGFGVEVAQRLATHELPEGVRVEDYGIRGLHLSLELLDGYDLLVLVDALAGSEAPGTVTLMEPTLQDDSPPLDAHAMNPQAVLGRVADMGGEIGRVLVVGCQPADTSDGIGLSAPVSGAVDTAVKMLLEILQEERNPTCVVS